MAHYHLMKSQTAHARICQTKKSRFFTPFMLGNTTDPLKQCAGSLRLVSNKLLKCFSCQLNKNTLKTKAFAVQFLSDILALNGPEQPVIDLFSHCHGTLLTDRRFTGLISKPGEYHLANGVYSRIFPSLSWGIFSRDELRPI